MSGIFIMEKSKEQILLKYLKSQIRIWK